MHTRGRAKLVKALGQPGWNQTRLAALLNIGQPSVSLYVTGRARPDALQRKAIAAIFPQISEHDWLSDEERREHRKLLRTLERERHPRTARTGTDG